MSGLIRMASVSVSALSDKKQHHSLMFNFPKRKRGCRCRDHMAAGFTTTCAISAYGQYWCCEFESRSRRGIQHYVIKFVGEFSPGPPVSSTNKTDSHDITEILLKVVLIKHHQTNKQLYSVLFSHENV